MKPSADFVLTPWKDFINESDPRAALVKKRAWVVASPHSAPLWYTTILGNLLRCSLVKNEPSLELVRETLNEGLGSLAFNRLKQIALVSSEDLSRAVGVPMRTLARRKKFKPDESERILRVASAFQKTLDLFEDLDRARRWFSSPQRALGGKTPLEYCDTGPGAEEVERLAGRLEHGVFT